ncbi:MAG: hypothetical protein HY887_09995 [Deltaproteobacteria bacterium]|nr:hypothetical protein [Deltaproteobacteria bacterium]
MKVGKALVPFLSPSTPKETRLKAAQRTASEAQALSPEDQVTLLFALSYDKEGDVKEAARRSFAGIEPDILMEALDGRLDPLVLKNIVSVYRDNETILIMAALNANTDIETLKSLAETGPEEIVALLCDELARLKAHPELLDALRKNPCSRNFIIDELAESLKKELSAEAPKQEGIGIGAGAQAQAKESLAKAKVKAAQIADDEHNIYKLIKGLTVGQKIKVALTGGKAIRGFLVNDTNKVVSSAVLKNPRITEDEVMRVITSKGTSDDMLRQVGRHKEWVKNYNIKLNMVLNPKTPLPISLKFLDHLYEKDLMSIAKGKNVPSVLASAARRKVEAKKKK